MFYVTLSSKSISKYVKTLFTLHRAYFPLGMNCGFIKSLRLNFPFPGYLPSSVQSIWILLPSKLGCVYPAIESEMLMSALKFSSKIFSEDVRNSSVIIWHQEYLYHVKCCWEHIANLVLQAQYSSLKGDTCSGLFGC